jgi:hypothetical protein
MFTSATITASASADRKPEMAKPGASQAARLSRMA